MDIREFVVADQFFFLPAIKSYNEMYKQLSVVSSIDARGKEFFNGYKNVDMDLWKYFFLVLFDFEQNV